MLLFSRREIEHLIGILDKDSSFCLCLRDIDAACVNSDFGSQGLFYRAFGFTSEDHALYHLAPRQTPAHDLHYSYIVDIEVFRIGGHDDQSGLSDQSGESIFVAVLFRRNRGFQCLCQ